MTPEHADFFQFLNEYAQDELAKAKKPKQLPSPDPPARDDPKTFFVNPYDFVSQSGLWQERRSSLTWDTLRIMAEKNPIVSSIINTRIRQIGVFSVAMTGSPVAGNDPLGFKVIHNDINKKLSKSDTERIIEIERFISYCGYEAPGRDNFDTWLKKIVRDSLTFDAAVTELLPTRKGGLHSFYAVDGATIRQALPSEKDDLKRYVQVLNGQVVTEYEPDELFYAVRNPTTNIRNNGYGVSELEQLVSVVTNIFNAMTHNSQFFQNGAAVKGLINIKTGKNQTGVMGDQLEAFKRAWRAMVTGTRNAWSTPILQTDGVEFVNMGSTNREMEFHQYLDFLVKIACAVYSIDPGEINFYMQAGGQGGHAMFESGQEAKLKMSKDKGLRPLLSSVARWINQHILPLVSDEHKFTWVGVDSKDEKELVEIRAKEGGAYATVDEVRKDAGREPIGEEKGGNLILNPHYITWLQQKSMAESMAQQGGGDEGEAPDNQGQVPNDEGEPGEAPEDEEKEAAEGAGDEQGDDIEDDGGGSGGKTPGLEKSLRGVEQKYLRFILAD